MEEWIFRGYVLNATADLSGSGFLAIAVSATAFGLHHL